MTVQLTTNKSKIKDDIKAIFGHIPKGVNSDEDQRFAVGEKEWFTYFTLQTIINAMISHNGDQCSALHFSTVDVLAEIINSKSRVSHKVNSKVHNCIGPLNTGNH